MALKLNERYPGRFNSPTAQYPQGSFKNRTAPGAKDGSYLEQDWANDALAFLSSLLSGASITPNGQVDTVGASQYYTALKKLIDNHGLSRFTSNGSFTVPANVTQIWVSGCGAGGGGGSSLATNSSSFVTGGSGGGAGQPALNVPITVTPGQVIPITIGTGGTGATAATNNATAGGNTQLGAGGSLMNLGGGSPGLIGGGGTGFPGDYGGPAGGSGYPAGGPAQNTTSFSATTATGGQGGQGAGGPFGQAGPAARGSTNSNIGAAAGYGYGAGGGGAGGAYRSTVSAPGGGGASGLNGYIVIEW